MMMLRCLLLLLLATISQSACPGGYRFIAQPPSELDCNPADRHIPLKCSSGSASDIVTWYRTQTAGDAGIRGTAIVESPQHTVVNFGSTNMKQISFIVTSSTQGYYWCEITNAVNVSLRPSTITPVLLTINTSLPSCTFTHVLSLSNKVPECAAAIEVTTTLPSSNKKSMRPILSSGAPTLITSDPVTLPTMTTTTSSISSHTTTSTTTAPPPPTVITTITIALIVYAACCTLTILLLVIIVILMCFRKRKRAAIVNALGESGHPNSTVIYETVSTETGKHRTTASDKYQDAMVMIQNVSYGTHCSQKLPQRNDFYDSALDQNEPYHSPSQQTEYDYIAQ